MCRSDADFASLDFPTGIGSPTSHLTGHHKALGAMLSLRKKVSWRSSSVIPEADAVSAKLLSQHRRRAWSQVVNKMDENSVHDAWDKVLGYLAQFGTGESSETE